MQAADPEAGSAVIAFMERYEQENPPDNSPAGCLARISGFTKPQVELALAELEYQIHVAKYNPELAYNPTKIQPQISFLALPPNHQEDTANIISLPIFDNLRYRSFAA